MQYSKNSFGKSNIFLVAAPTNHRMLDAPRLSYCPDCSRHREIGSNVILIWFHIEKNGGNILTSYFLESKYRRHFLQSKCKLLWESRNFNSEDCMEKIVFPFMMNVWVMQAVCNRYSTVPETYFPPWTVSEGWAHSEWTVSARWMEFSESLWTMNGERTQITNGVQMRAQSERWTICEHYMKSWWTIYSECLGSFPYIVFRR